MRYLWQKTYPRWFCCLSSKQLKWKDKRVQEGKYQVRHKEPKRQKRLSKGYLQLSLFGRCPDYGTCHFPCLILFPWMYSPLQSISLPSLLHFVLKMIFPDQISSILYSHLYVGPYYTLRQSIPVKDTDLKVYLHFCSQRSMKPETTPECLKNYTTVSVQHVYFVDPLKIACS